MSAESQLIHIFACHRFIFKTFYFKFSLGFGFFLKSQCPLQHFFSLTKCRSDCHDNRIHACTNSKDGETLWCCDVWQGNSLRWVSRRCTVRQSLILFFCVMHAAGFRRQRAVGKYRQHEVDSHANLSTSRTTVWLFCIHLFLKSTTCVSTTMTPPVYNRALMETPEC